MKYVRYLDRIRYIGEFKRSTRDPAKVQKKILMRILRHNKDTEYGKRYGFSRIRTVEEFRSRVPVIGYDDIKDYIEKIKAGEKNVLTSEEVIYFATSSGTTSEPKFIPITRRRLDDFKREFALWGMYVLKDYIKIFLGKTLYFAAGDYNGKTKGGIPYGNISGYHVKKLPWIVKQRVVLDSEVYNIKDPDERMKTIAISALKVKNITQIAFTFPIEAIKFFEYIRENKDVLVKEIREEGYLSRAQELDRIIDPKPIIIWPDLCLINCIKSGMNALYLDHLLEMIGKRIDIRDPGVYASEGRITNGFDKDGYSSLIAASFNFFEFREKDKGGNYGEPVTIDKLRKGREYSVIMTTKEGLYRYEIGDVFKVIGFWDKLPLVNFVSRDKFLDIAGEHSPEHLLTEGVRKAAEEMDIKFRGFCVVPYFKNSTEDLRYEVLFEPTESLDKKKAKELIKLVDKVYQETILTYKKSRNEFDRFEAPVLSVIRKGSYDDYDKRRLTNSGQTKLITVHSKPDYRENFEIEDTIIL